MLAGQVIRMKPKNKLQTVDCIEEASQRFERLNAGMQSKTGFL